MNSLVGSIPTQSSVQKSLGMEDQLPALLQASTKLNGVLGANGSNKVICWTLTKLIKGCRHNISLCINLNVEIFKVIIYHSRK